MNRSGIAGEREGRVGRIRKADKRDLAPARRPGGDDRPSYALTRRFRDRPEWEGREQVAAGGERPDLRLEQLVGERPKLDRKP
jgi:hypothetical protein